MIGVLLSILIIVLPSALIKNASSSDNSAIQSNKGCSIRTTDLNPEPIVTLASKPSTFLYPDPKTGHIYLPPQTLLLISCPGTYLTLNTSIPNPTLKIACVKNATFSLNRTKELYFYDIRCAKKVLHTVKNTNKNCAASAQILEIGFQLTKDIFLPQIAVCFQNTTRTTLYAKHLLTKTIKFREHGIKRPSFIEGDVYHPRNQSLTRLYSRSNQRAAINSLVGLPANSTKYIKKSSYFLSRGHLAPKADFLYSNQQLASFYYVNTSPQWQNINGRNWQKIESNIRSLAEKRGLDLVVYTGGHGVATLPHQETGEQTELYLGGDKIAVARFIWKMVLDVEGRRGVVVVSVNNPYLEDEKREFLCEDVAEELDWLGWKKGREVKFGVVFACGVEEFKMAVGATFPREIRDDYGLLV